MVKKEYTVYTLKNENEIVFIGITNDFLRRINEHADSGKEFTSFDFFRGLYTLEDAEEKEALELMSYQNTHRGEAPKYNI
ncbi:MAG: GIY-YIG nuclease family protein [Candidatus Thermoplasmatota archaeon]|nr:GIY-YIG nuclease family protein [Candidatus Thermoplasmatota archaeon]